jgi:hypothetical protein
MNSSTTDRRAGRGLGPIAALSAIAVLIAGCETTREMVAHKEDSLTAAGFTARPANTPKRIAMLKRLPPHRFVQKPDGDTMDYVYADPVVCRCLYVGAQQAYAQYIKNQQAQDLANEQLMAAQMYSDPAWDWGGWGPWGGGFGRSFRGGRGW